MKKITVALLLAACAAQAQAADICVSGYDLIVRLGKSRDAGVPMKSLLEEAATLDNAVLREVVEGLVVAVYSHPEIPVQKQAADFYKGCKEPVSKPAKAGTNRGGV